MSDPQQQGQGGFFDSMFSSFGDNLSRVKDYVTDVADTFGKVVTDKSNESVNFVDGLVSPAATILDQFTDVANRIADVTGSKKARDYALASTNLSALGAEAQDKVRNVRDKIGYVAQENPRHSWGNPNVPRDQEDRAFGSSPEAPEGAYGRKAKKKATPSRRSQTEIVSDSKKKKKRRSKGKVKQFQLAR